MFDCFARDQNNEGERNGKRNGTRPGADAADLARCR